MADEIPQPQNGGHMPPPPPEAAPAPTPAPAPTSYSGGPVRLRDRYLIDPNAPIPELDSPSAKAYAAEDRRDPGRNLFALICTPGLPPRVNVIGLQKANPIRGLLPVVDWDAINWPPLSQRSMAVIFERPMGGRLIDAIISGRVRISEHELIRRYIEPLSAALQGLGTLGVAHRAIRPDNIFFMDKEGQTVVLGDGVTAPAGFDQPLICETIERAMTSPAGRGEGDSRDDMYALGVTMVLILLGQNPVGNLSEDDLLHAKVEHGTYATLCGGTRISLSFIEPLRGMLSDDVEERWGPPELDLWINGRKMTPIQRKPARRASQPFSFGGRDHVSPRTVARAFSMNVADGARALKEGALFDTWVRRHLSDPALADRLQGIVDQARVFEGQPNGSDEVIVARIAMFLDPAGPVRYKGFSFMLDGYGAALAVDLLRRGDMQVGAEALAREMPETWIAAQGKSRAETLEIMKTYTQLKGFLKITDPGYGVERVLYEMNHSLPCQSPFIIQEYVTTIEELLPALDRVANRVEAKSKPLDRHVTAFISARFQQDIHPHLKALAATKEETSLIGMLSLLAFLQWKLRIETLLGLSSWVGGLLGPAINTYYSRTTRRDIEREIPRLVRKGSLPEIFDLIDNAEKRRVDAEGYGAAQTEFIAAEAEIQDLQGVDGSRLAKAERTGQQAAAMSSIVLSMLIVTVLFLLHKW